MSKFEIHRSKDPKQPFYFVEVGDNGEILTTSETYTRLQSAIEGAQAAGAEADNTTYKGEE